MFLSLRSLLVWSIILFSVIISPLHSLITLSRLISTVGHRCPFCWSISRGGGGAGVVVVRRHKREWGLINALPLRVRLAATHRRQIANALSSETSPSGIKVRSLVAKSINSFDEPDLESTCSALCDPQMLRCETFTDNVLSGLLWLEDA